MKAKQMSQVKSPTSFCFALFMPVLDSLIPSAIIQQALTFYLMWNTLRWAMGVELGAPTVRLLDSDKGMNKRRPAGGEKQAGPGGQGKGGLGMLGWKCEE